MVDPPASGPVPNPDSGIRLVKMRASDLDAVVAIESSLFSNPWRKDDFAFSLQREGSDCRIVQLDGWLVGYTVGFFVAREYHLADFGIHSQFQRQGIGTKVMRLLLNRLERSNVNVVTLEVRSSNTYAIPLYKKLGFQTMAIRKDYYRRPREDALVMLKAIKGRMSDWIEAAATGLPENP